MSSKRDIDWNALGEQMSDVAFNEAFKKLAAALGCSIQVPRGAPGRPAEQTSWRLEDGPIPVIVATTPAKSLTQNIQTDEAAVTTFAFCLAWWFERLELLGPRKVCARVEFTGDITSGQHTNRSLFVLHELQILLGDPFTYTPTAHLRWPRRPHVNEGADDRSGPAGDAPVPLPHSPSERDLEIAFTTQPQLREQFAAIESITGFRRQLPVGIFDGAVTKTTRWSPGGKSQIDLWAVSEDGNTVHLFELKKPGNLKLGMLPEALWYARLLYRIRVGDFGGARVEGGGEAMDIVRAAKRIRMWLLAPSVHPLLGDKTRSPLAWLNAGLKGTGLDFGILPFELGAILRLQAEERWDCDLSRSERA